MRYLSTDSINDERGSLFSAALVIVYFMLEFSWGVKVSFARANSAITDLQVPGFPARRFVGLMFDRVWHKENFGTTTSTFAPYGSAVPLTAVATSGIVFSVQRLSKARSISPVKRGNPAKSAPFAVIGSILLALVIYVLLLQIAYIGAVSPGDVMKVGGSHFTPASPFVQNWRSR